MKETFTISVPSMGQRSDDHAGFTMIELLVVVVVIGILAAVVDFSLKDTASNAKLSACVSEQNVITNSLILFRNATGSYPTASEGLAALAQPATHYLTESPDPTQWAYDPTTGTVVGIGSCAILASSSTPVITGTVTVFAATSLTSVFNDIKAKLTAVSPGLNLVLSFGGSATLKAQINSGTSPADVFAAADLLNAPNATLVAASAQFASNKLTIITRPGNPLGIGTLNDLFAPGLQVVLCQSAQPCGNASNQAFSTINKTRANLGANLVSETANVGLVVTSVQSGAPNTAGLVYVTDAIVAGSSVSMVIIPDANNFVNHYPVYLINNPNPSSNVIGAQKFLNYLVSPEGQALLASRGFGAP